MDLNGSRSLWQDIIVKSPNYSVTELAQAAVPMMMSALRREENPLSWPENTISGSTDSVLELFDLCFKDFDPAMARTKDIKVMDAFCNATPCEASSRAIFSSGLDHDILLRIITARRRLEAQFFPSTSGPYKGCARSFGIASWANRIQNLLSRIQIYVYKKAICDCRKCSYTLAGFHLYGSRKQVEHIGNNAERKHLIEMASLSGRVAHHITKPSTRLLLTLIKKESEMHSQCDTSLSTDSSHIYTQKDWSCNSGSSIVPIKRACTHSRSGLPDKYSAFSTRRASNIASLWARIHQPPVGCPSAMGSPGCSRVGFKWKCSEQRCRCCDTPHLAAGRLRPIFSAERFHSEIQLLLNSWRCTIVIIIFEPSASGH